MPKIPRYPALTDGDADDIIVLVRDGITYKMPFSILKTYIGSVGSVGDMLKATYDPAAKAAQLLAISDIVTAIGSPGSDSKIASEQGIREALNAIDQKKVKSTYFATITSGTTSGQITKPAGAGADVDFIMDEWGTATDALLSTIENGKPTFKSPVNAGGSPITTTFDTAGNYTFSDTPSPASDTFLVYVYSCYLKNYNIAESLFESELIDYVADHADSHTDGTDDIQSATSEQKGLATSTQITKLDEIEASAVALATVKADTDVASAITLKHASGSDDQDLSGLVEKETGKSLVADTEILKIHASGGDTALGAQTEDLDMNSHQVVSLSVPDAAGEAIRQTAKITEAALETLVDGGGGGDTLPIADTTAVVKGSVDATKLVRIEADGLTTGTTRVLTMPDKDITPAASGANSDITSMTGLDDDGIPLAKVDGATGDQDLSGYALKGANADITSMTGLSNDGIPLAKVDGATSYADADAKAAAVQAGAITNGVTKAPTHDAVYDVKVTADAAQTSAEVTSLIGSTAPQAHKTSHQNGGGDEISIAALSGLAADDQHVLDAEVQAISINNVSEDTTPDLAGPLGVGEHSIQLDATLSATTKYSGITCDIVIGYASAAFGDLVYLANADDRWEKTDANAEGTSGDVMLGIVISAGSSDGDAGVVMLQGFLKLTAWDFPLGGDALYVSETAGAMTATRPTTASTIVRVVGYAGVDADTVYFNPSGTWIETAA